MKTWKRWNITVWGILSTFLLAHPVWCQPAPDQVSDATKQKIGFVDISTIEDEWIDFQLLKSDFEKLLKIDRNDIENLQTSILKREEKLKEQRAEGRMTEQQYQNWHNRLIRESQEVAIYAKVRSKLVKDKVARKLDRADKIVEEMIQQVGDEESYDLIISTEEILGSDPALDISPLIIKHLNERTYTF